MSAAPRLHLTRARPQMRGPVGLTDALSAHPHNAINAASWLRAIAYLRDKSQRGWILDARDYPTRTEEKRA